MTDLTITPLRVAFIGAGNMARLHLQALRRVGIATTVVGVHDASSRTAAEFATLAGAKAYPTLAGLLSEAAADVVHVCTPAGAHFAAAREALLYGAHVYVEKPFVETSAECEQLLRLAASGNRLICPGHQLLWNAGFRQLLSRIADLQPGVLVDSYFAFRPPRLQLQRASPRALVSQLLDVLPHPLSTLVAMLERLEPTSGDLEVVATSATPVELHAVLRKGDLSGRLFVSLRARPVASTLGLIGGHGTLTADLARAILVGAGNAGTEPLEKMADPLFEAGQLAWRSSVSVVRRLLTGGSYPGLVELLREFYGAIATGQRSPIPATHLQRTTAVYESLAAEVRRCCGPVAAPVRSPSRRATQLPVAVVTGAGGFFGAEIARELDRRGFFVRGISRSEPAADRAVQEWIHADLSQELPANALADAAVVVHAAAETSGGFASHERNTVESTRNLLRAMKAVGVRRLVHVSSLSVLRPPKTPWERQTEQTPLPNDPKDLGPYTWGKCVAEAVVAAAGQNGDIEPRIVRPAALIDWDHGELPSLVGRRLFGRWHLGFGRPGLPFAVCDVRRAAAAVAWCAQRFGEAPGVVNLMDHTVRTRGQLIDSLRAHGWRGRVVWVPISVLAGLVVAARSAVALAHFHWPQPLAVWSILRPRRYDASVAEAVLEAAQREADLPSVAAEPHSGRRRRLEAAESGDGRVDARRP
jgi:predicted dehydrogenase/nucleoside-diphosphate-sugar epimerase